MKFVIHSNCRLLDPRGLRWPPDKLYSKKSINITFHPFPSSIRTQILLCYQFTITLGISNHLEGVRVSKSIMVIPIGKLSCSLAFSPSPHPFSSASFCPPHIILYSTAKIVCNWFKYLIFHPMFEQRIITFLFLL